MCAWAQDPQQAPPAQSSSQQAGEARPKLSPRTAPPRSGDAKDDTSSSSKDTKIDLSPPPGDASHPGSAAADDINEFHAYDPHKAEKDVEVGDFYVARKNYEAAISRYRSALGWKPNDATATFHLAEALEKAGQLEESRKSYQDYLRILPHGPNAAQAKTAVQRLTLQSESRSQNKR